MTVFSGRIATLSDQLATYSNARHLPTDAIGLWPKTGSVAEALTSCDVEDVLLTSAFVPIDLNRKCMFLDQTYTGVAGVFPTRFHIEGATYRLESQPLFSSGRHVVIGGPIDGVWYHWLFNWCPRILLTKILRPDLLAADDVRFVVHPTAMREPFRAILDTFGLEEARFLVIDPERDYRLEQATLVSFPDQNKLYPTLIRSFSDHLLDAFDIKDGVEHKGIFASRQNLPAPKRRIANFAAVRPVLDAFDLRILDLGTLSAAEQARLFYEAAMVVGAHGSDLSNVLFCRPGTPLVVIESRFSVDHDLHLGLLKLAEVLELPYHLIVSATTDDVSRDLPVLHSINRDYVLDPEALKETLQALSAHH